MGKDTTVVAFFSSAEFSCFLALGWPLPHRIVDLYAEHRVLTNGIKTYHHKPNSLLGAALFYNLQSMSAEVKDTSRDLIMKRKSALWSGEERKIILDYCEADVKLTAQLYQKMLPLIDWNAAKLRGRYMKAVARVERAGIPIDVPLHQRLVRHWQGIKTRLVRSVDEEFGVYLHTKKGASFNHEMFEAYLDRSGIVDWPYTRSGRRAVNRETFKEMAIAYPQIKPLAELQGILGELRIQKLQVAEKDGHNRAC